MSQTLPNQIRINNVILNDPLSVAQAFNRHFSSVCFAIMPEPSIAGDFNDVRSRHSNNTCPGTGCHYDIKASSGPGLDGTDTQFIKVLSHILMYPLCDPFNVSSTACEIPAIWKCSRITL